jgi:UDP-N-acetylmuramoyl-tripeptide--D-alanyl-D-alanine ligase
VQPGVSLLVIELGVGGEAMDEMVEFLHPDVAVITGLGPVRLDRLGTQEEVDVAVLAPARSAGTVIVNRGDARLAQRATSDGSCRWDRGAVTVAVIESGEWEVRIDDEVVSTIPAIRGGYPASVACAASAALVLGVSRETVIARCATLTPPPSTIATAVTPAGLRVFVDIRGTTPAEGSFAVRTLRECDVSGRKVMVTPGVVQLGPAQGYENFRLGALVAQSGAELVAIARTNAEPLIDGYSGPVRRFDKLREARDWVQRTLGADDAVMYFNDLEDHYP